MQIDPEAQAAIARAMTSSRRRATAPQSLASPVATAVAPPAPSAPSAPPPPVMVHSSAPATPHYQPPAPPRQPGSSAGGNGGGGHGGGAGHGGGVNSFGHGTSPVSKFVWPILSAGLSAAFALLLVSWQNSSYEKRQAGKIAFALTPQGTADLASKNKVQELEAQAALVKEQADADVARLEASRQPDTINFPSPGKGKVSISRQQPVAQTGRNTAPATGFVSIDPTVGFGPEKLKLQKFNHVTSNGTNFALYSESDRTVCTNNTSDPEFAEHTTDMFPGWVIKPFILSQDCREWFAQGHAHDRIRLATTVGQSIQFHEN